MSSVGSGPEGYSNQGHLMRKTEDKGIDNVGASERLQIGHIGGLGCSSAELRIESMNFIQEMHQIDAWISNFREILELK